MSQKVVITGVRGFVGQNLKKYLKENSQFELIGSSRDKAALEKHKSSLNQICSYDDICAGMLNFDFYVHLAGKVIGLTNEGDDKEYFKINFEQTKNIFDRFTEDKNAKKFIFISTIHVVTEKPDRVIDESYEPKPFTPYGKSKYLAEKYIESNCPPDKKYYILRPSMIHGPGNKGNLNLLYGLISRGLPYPVGAVNNKRSFVSVDNMCFIINKILENNINSGLYHIADDDPTYTHQLVNLIAEKTNRKPRFLNIQIKYLKWIAKIGNYIPIGLNDYKLQKLTSDFIVSNKKIKKEIGESLPVKSEQGIKRTIESFISE